MCVAQCARSLPDTTYTSEADYYCHYRVLLMQPGPSLFPPLPSPVVAFQRTLVSSPLSSCCPSVTPCSQITQTIFPPVHQQAVRILQACFGRSEPS